MHSVYDKVCYGTEGNSIGLHHAVDLLEGNDRFPDSKRDWRSFRRRHRPVPESGQAGLSPEFSFEFSELVSSPWLCSDGAERPDDPPVCGDSLDLPGYDEARGTRYCGFDPSQSQWILAIILAFS